MALNDPAYSAVSGLPLYTSGTPRYVNDCTCCGDPRAAGLCTYCGSLAQTPEIFRTTLNLTWCAPQCRLINLSGSGNRYWTSSGTTATGTYDLIRYQLPHPSPPATRTCVCTWQWWGPAPVPLIAWSSDDSNCDGYVGITHLGSTTFTHWNIALVLGTEDCLKSYEDLTGYFVNPGLYIYAYIPGVVGSYRLAWWGDLDSSGISCAADGIVVNSGRACATSPPAIAFSGNATTTAIPYP
jgi:hypothetical protein